NFLAALWPCPAGVDNNSKNRRSSMVGCAMGPRPSSNPCATGATDSRCDRCPPLLPGECAEDWLNVGFGFCVTDRMRRCGTGHKKERPPGMPEGVSGKEGIASVTAPLSSAAANHQQHQGDHASNEQRQTAGFGDVEVFLRQATSALGAGYRCVDREICIVAIRVIRLILGLREPPVDTRQVRVDIAIGVPSRIQDLGFKDGPNGPLDIAHLRGVRDVCRHLFHKPGNFLVLCLGTKGSAVAYAGECGWDRRPGLAEVDFVL